MRQEIGDSETHWDEDIIRRHNNTGGAVGGEIGVKGNYNSK